MIIDESKNEIAFKIVYWGVGLSGKTSNLQYVWSRTPPELRSDMKSIATETERALFFSMLPRTLGPIDGRAVRLWLFCVPGSVFYDMSRELILKAVDGVVFVADTQADRLEANVESLSSLEQTLAEHTGRRIADVPFVIQYNKRDLANAMPIAHLDRALNPRAAPAFEAIASHGEGVFDTLKSCAHRVVASASVTRAISGPQTA